MIILLFASIIRDPLSDRLDKNDGNVASTCHTARWSF